MQEELIPPEEVEASLVFDSYRIDRVATANLPTQFGHFKIVSFQNNKDFKEHVALFCGDIEGDKTVLTRLHSECMTGDVFSSLKCDCGEQLARALKTMSSDCPSLLIYLRQEGRGIGLTNKIRAYKLQDGGLDTVEANHHLGFDDDLRTYDIAAGIIKLLNVKQIALMTNNPKKVEGLRAQGIDVVERLPIEVTPNEYNHDYLETKAEKSGHLLEKFKCDKSS